MCNNFISFLFFFSSRRRHTRYWRDWSSDVCSSDLDGLRDGAELHFGVDTGAVSSGQLDPAIHCLETLQLDLHCIGRSEERRVGKECRYRRSLTHYKINSK